MRRALDAVALVAPEWLREQMQPDWVERYGRRFDGYRLPRSWDKRLALAEKIGQLLPSKGFLLRVDRAFDSRSATLYTFADAITSVTRQAIWSAPNSPSRSIP